MEEFVQGKFVRDTVFYLPCNLDLCSARLQNVPLLFWAWKGSRNIEISVTWESCSCIGKILSARAGCFVAVWGWVLCNMPTRLLELEDLEIISPTSSFLLPVPEWEWTIPSRAHHPLCISNPGGHRHVWTSQALKFIYIVLDQPPP